ncbi:hypothetical protein [Microbacterium oxydans]|uniref:hypothetical protein n=1 Tax=Microbacterium oxydans TaxID=82380 RepID=UPI000F8FA0EA|nr:hypothetical protein [Microbacterium oxydans]AZS46656.1 hypothetical protein CVS53_01330 [Microbacterium oxydans]
MTHRSEVYGIAMKMLDQLPEGSVVLDSDGDAWQKQDVRWTSVARGANTELMGSNSLAILTPLTVVYRTDAEPESEPSDARVEAAARRLFGATVDSMTRARELARVALTAKPLIECPHWAPGKITFRNGCTACTAGERDV